MQFEKQLLDTALAGKEDYDAVEAEVLRLFRDLHNSDPLQKRVFEQKPLLQRFLNSSQQHGHGGRTSVPSSGSSHASTFRSFRSASSNSSTKPGGFSKPFQPASRQAMVAEGVEEDEPEEEELLPADDAEQAGPSSLEEVLQAEAEVLASELQQLEDEGAVEPQLLEELENGVEAAAESLVTMREARSRIAEVRKDRGFGKAGTGKGNFKPKLHGNQATAKKATTKCWDCGEPGHWGGDPQCRRPGAGLFKPKGKGTSNAPAEHVKVAEALNTEHAIEVVDNVANPDDAHEVMVCSSRQLSLPEVLDYVNESNAAQTQVLSLDKRMIGALDSACNRTCSGSVWLNHYVKSLEKAPKEIQNLIKASPEREVFRFGNGGCKTSFMRYRLPMMVGSSLLTVWVSVVDVPSLGLLLGRDFLDAVGAVLSFSRKMLRADLLDGSLVPLRQIAAGHFALRLAPPTWTLPGALRWRRTGQDGVVEVQVSSEEWLKRKLSAHAIHAKPEHEHLVTEQGVQAADLVHSGLIVQPVDDAASQLLARPAQAMCSSMSSRSTTTSSPASPTASSPADRAPIVNGARKPRQCVKGDSHALGKNVAAPHKPRGMARSWHALMVAAAAATTVLAGAISQCDHHRPVAFAKRADGQQSSVATSIMAETLDSESSQERQLYHGQHDRAERFPKPPRTQADVLGRPSADGHDGSAASQRSRSCDAKGRSSRSSSTSQEDRRARPEDRSDQTADRAKRWSPNSQGRSTSTCSSTPHHGVREGHCGGPQGPVQALGERAQGGPSEEIKRKQFQRNGCRAQSCGAEAQSQSSSSWNAKAWDGHHRKASLREHPGHASNPGQPRRAIPSNAVASHAACDAHGKPSVSSGPWGDASTIRSRCRRADGRTTIDPRGGARHSIVGGGGPLCGELHEAAWSASRRGHSVERDRWVNPWKIHQELRPGLSQQISQAWERHERDRRLVSRSAKEVEAAMDFEWESNMMDFMNETFVTTIDLAHPQLREPLVQEIFTATQRVTLEAQKRGHLTGDPLSLESGWDFMKALDRRAAYAKVKREKPFFLVLAYPCGPWSPLQRLNPAADLPEKREAHRELIRFALSLARLQLRNGRHFILENPLGSESWNLPEIIKFLEEEEAKLARFDQCRFNLRSEQGWLHRKATQVATSSESVHSHLDQVRCTGDHPHQPVIGGSKITARAGHYPGQLAKTLVKAMEEEFERQFAAQPKEALAMEDGGGEVSGEEEEEPMAPGVDVPSSSEDGQPDGLEKVAISPAVKQAVKRLHENTGHRSNKRLARALTLTGAPPEVIRAARLHKCSVCQEMRAPKASRPASLPTPKDVSDQVHIDIFEGYDLAEQRFYIVHAIDHCSRFQLAEVLPDKSSKSVTTFLKKRWFPIFGTPRVLIADQGREFVSWEFEQLCAENSVLLWHCAVQAPWQNGLCERGGGIIKAILNSIIKSQSVMGKDDMDLALQEAITAYNGDVNELGVSPAQAAMGRQPRIQGDVLGDFGQRVAEHGLVDSRLSLARQVAMRETARVAMARLHFSRGLRKALLSRSRNTTVTQPLEPGSIVYYFRQTKYNNKTSGSKKKLSLRRWHGPALLVANEGTTNCFLSHKGQLTKCAREHVRLASTMEQIAAETWRDAIDEVVEAAMHDQARRQQQQPSAPEHADEAVPEAAQADPAILEAPAQPQQQANPAPADLPPVGPQEFVQAIRPADDVGPAVSAMASSVPQSVASSRRPMRSRSPVPDAVLRAGLMKSPTTAPVAFSPATPVAAATTAAPKTPSAPATPRLSRAMERAQDLTAEPLAGKREAEMTLDELARTLPSRSSASASTSGPAKSHDALVLSREEVEEVQAALQQDDLHPLRRLFLEAATEEANPMDFEFEDRGTWKGSWPLPSRSQLRAMKAVGAMLPRGEQEAMAVQTARKEYKWRDMTPEAKAEFREAAWKGWQTWVDNDAVEVLRPEEAKRIRENLRQTNKSHLILRPRYVYTDKNDGLRTEERQLPLKASARLVVPGYKDVSAYEVRKDAPTASRTSVHLLLVFFTASKGWHLLSADVKAAFLKGELFLDGERILYIENLGTNDPTEPRLPLGAGGLARLRKGIFGLSDSPRRWYLRLHKSLEALGWKRSSIDSALWMLWSPTGECEGMICSHVDDLLLVATTEQKNFC